MASENVYRNNKTWDVYVVLEHGAINATNAQDGQCMVVYADSKGRVFCRERAEFLEKFTKLGVEIPIPGGNNK